MLPYLGWTCFATTLINCSLWDSNPEVVQSAHDVAQIKPQVNPQTGATDLAPGKSVGHKRNNTWSAGIGQVVQAGSPQTAGQGGVVYSSRPIFPRSNSQEQLAPTGKQYQPSQPSFPGFSTDQHVQGNSQLQPSQRQPEHRPLLQQTSWSHSPSWEHSSRQQQQDQQQQQAQQGQQATHSPFAQAPAGARDTGEMFAERRTTRRTTDDQLAPERYGQLSDSGHLIMPGQDKTERMQSASSSGLFSRVQKQDSLTSLPTPLLPSLSLPPCLSQLIKAFESSSIMMWSHRMCSTSTAACRSAHVPSAYTLSMHQAHPAPDQNA